MHDLVHCERCDLLAGIGAEPMAGTPEQFAALVRADVAKWTKVIQDAGIKVD